MKENSAAVEKNYSSFTQLSEVAFKQLNFPQERNLEVPRSRFQSTSLVE
jgi:hypothetical protein